MKKLIFPMIVVGGLVVIGYFSSHYTQDSKEVIYLGTVSSCNPLKVKCRITKENVGLVFYLPSNVEYLKPFQVEITSDGINNSDIDKVTVTFEMSDMDMGQNQFVLKPRGSIYSGEAVLPVCVTGRVDWTARVDVITEDRVYQAIFKFSVAK